MRFCSKPVRLAEFPQSLRHRRDEKMFRYSTESLEPFLFRDCSILLASLLFPLPTAASLASPRGSMASAGTAPARSGRVSGSKEPSASSKTALSFQVTSRLRIVDQLK